MFWPDLIRPDGIALRDAGLSFVTFDADGSMDVVVACVGLVGSSGIEERHLPELLEPVQRFDRLGLRCCRLVLLHNLDGRARDVEGAVTRRLAELKSSGRAETAELWSRDMFIDDALARLRTLVVDRLHEQSQAMLRQTQTLFEVGEAFVLEVPVAASRLRLKPGSPPSIEPEHSSASTAPVAEILSSAGARSWTLLTGLYGSGKTSAALHAAADRSHEVIYVHAGSLAPRQGENSTNIVMTRIADELGLFGDMDDGDRRVLERLSGPILRSMLSDDHSMETLIIDALDENRSLETPEAITTFASTLTELRCNLVLITRQEHFRATFGNFDHLFERLSWRGGGSRNIRLLELEAWSDRQVLELVTAVAAARPDNSELGRLRDGLAAGDSIDWETEFLRHPFFLRMILDLVAEGEQVQRGRADLLTRWSRRKLIRDLMSGRALPRPVRDRDAFIEDVERLMEAAAAEMAELDAGRMTLLDAISSDRLLDLAEQILAVSHPELGPVLSVSLMVPAAVRFRRTVPVRFSHRAFQEFYLARSLVSAGQDGSIYPLPVQALMRELAPIPLGRAV